MNRRFLSPCLLLAAAALCDLAQAAAEYTWTDAAGAHAVTLARTAACIAVIAHILRQASELDAEHRQFV